jgi:3-hydroxyanthranilate 3,4-dioxygenase
MYSEYVLITIHLPIYAISYPAFSCIHAFHAFLMQEWFYQVKGNMILNTVQPDGRHESIVIREGDIYFLPCKPYAFKIFFWNFTGNIPHNPVRFANTIGLVIERIRPKTDLDQVRWYCRRNACRALLHEASFHVSGPDISQQIERQLAIFRDDIRLRTCKACGTISSHRPENFTYPQ